MSDSIQRVCASRVDGRANNARFIQKQLTNLHHALSGARSDLQNAIRNDSGHLPVEVEVEYHLAMACLREQFSSIDADKALEEEYSLAKMKDHPSNLVPVGGVYIIPSRHNLFYSIIAPLGVAIAAGNCVVLELKKTISELNSILRALLVSALDSDTFAVVDSMPNQPEFSSKNWVVVRGTADSKHSTGSRTVTSPSSKAVAIVDRTANVDEAAREIIRARFSFRGGSPYAPDVVLVNEFRLKDFCNAAVQQATKYFADQVETHTNGSASTKLGKNSSHGSAKDLKEDEATTLVSASRGTIVVVRKRQSQILNKKIDEALLLIHATSSLDDAIDFTNSSNEDSLLASYIFATPTSAKYLSQFIDSRTSCVNRIPVDLLVGPASPEGFRTSISNRYVKDMFSAPRPEYVTFPARSTLLSETLDGANREALKTLRKETQAPLPKIGQQPNGGNIGFFEQGLMTGALVVLTTTVAGLAVLGFYGASAVWRRLR